MVNAAMNFGFCHIEPYSLTRYIKRLKNINKATTAQKITKSSAPLFEIPRICLLIDFLSIFSPFSFVKSVALFWLCPQYSTRSFKTQAISSFPLKNGMFTGFLGNLKTQKKYWPAEYIEWHSAGHFQSKPSLFLFSLGLSIFSAVPRYKSPKTGNRIDSAVAVVADISFYDQMITGLLSLDIFISGYI